MGADGERGRKDTGEQAPGLTGAIIRPAVNGTP